MSKKAILKLFIGVILVLSMIYTYMLNDRKPSTLHQPKKMDEIVFLLPVMAMDIETPIEQIAEDFNKTNDVQVKVEKIHADQYQYQLNMRFLEEKSPDMFILEEDWIEAYEQEGWLADIASNIPSNGGKHPAQVVPLAVESFRLVCNKELFRTTGLQADTPPITITELYEMASHINHLSVGIVYGFVPYLKHDIEGFIALIEKTHKAYGKYYYDDSIQRYDFGIYKKWMDLMVRLQEESIIAEKFLDIRKDAVLGQYDDNIIGMTIISSQDCFWMDNTSLLDSVIAHVPLGDRHHEMGLPSMFFGVSNRTDAKEACLAFYKMLTSVESEQRIYEADYYIPHGYYHHAKTMKNSDNLLKDFLPDHYQATYYADPLYVGANGVRFNVYRQILEGDITVDDGIEKLTNLFNDMFEVTF